MNCKHSSEEAMKKEETYSVVEEERVKRRRGAVQEETHAHLNQLLNRRFQLKF